MTSDEKKDRDAQRKGVLLIHFFVRLRAPFIILKRVGLIDIFKLLIVFSLVFIIRKIHNYLHNYNL